MPPSPPTIIQGGMGVGVSSRRGARRVAQPGASGDDLVRLPLGSAEPPRSSAADVVAPLRGTLVAPLTA